MKPLEQFFWPVVGRSILFTFAADVAIAAGLVGSFGDEDDRLLEIGLVVLVILAVEMALSAKSWIVKSLWLHWFGKRYTEALVLEAMREARLPPPSSHHQRSFQFLADLADDTEADPGDRVKAAAIHAALSAQWSAQGLVRALMFTSAADAAVAKWISETPRRRV